ncbi:hypothetical protein J4E80_002094 [Alternaria sp. BMP 0032]|nr:hypothetical protein J4E80_002094 [Alternaria sp. BMP 0032]
MATKPPEVSAADKQWLIFRQKHEAELKGFQRYATESFAKFQDNVNKERAIILAKHQKEEEEFWSKAKAAADKEKKKVSNTAVGPKTGVQSQANRRVVAAPPRAAPTTKKTPAPRPKATSISKPASNTTAPVVGSRNKKAAVTIIDLCSDDDGDEPVLVKERPILQIAGQGPTEKDPPGLSGKIGNANTSEPEQLKREHSVFTQQPPHPLIQPPAPCASNSNTSGVHISNSVASQHAPAAVLSTQPNLVGGVGFGNWANVPRMPDARQGTALNVGGRGKRKVVDLSSDEESDYAPPSDDEEPSSPVMMDDAPEPVKKQTSRPATKKAKLPPPLPPALASKGVYNKGKNGFGFTSLQKSKPKVNSQTDAALPTTPPRVPTRKPQPTTPSTPTSASQKFKTVTLKTQGATVSRSPRKAKLDASAKITQLSEAELQTRTNIAIDEANQREEATAAAGIFEQVRGGMRAMSITPAPSTAGNAAEDVEMLANVSDSEITSPEHGAGLDSWTDSRFNGDRYIAKSRAARPIVEDDEDDDPDISKYSVIDGVIVHEADRERLRLTQEQERLTRSRGTDGGSRARVVTAVEMPEHAQGMAGQSGRRARKTMR